MRNAKQSIRRTVAGLLAGAMLLGMTPLAAFAEGSSSASGDWQFKAFGTSAAAGVNTIADGADINGKVTLNSCTIKDDGTIDKKGGKFVADSPADGLSFYYTTIDPTTQNFYLQADVTIDYVNPAPDGQEGFALMVRDSISGSGSYFSNQISVVGTKLPLDGVEIKDAVGVRSYTGIISNETAASNDVKSNRAAFSSQAIKQGDTYRVSLAKTSNSYVATQYAINADGSTGDVIGSSTLYIPAKDSTASSVSKYAELDDPMTVQEANKAYLGFAAARGMNVTFSNITYTTSTWNASEWTLQPTSYVAPVYQITSPATCTGDSYELVFKAHAAGKATGFISDGDIMRYLSECHPAITSSYSLMEAANSQTFDEKLKELVALPVSHIATERVVSIPQDATLQEACTLLAQHKLKKVPVVQNGAIVGMLSRSDVIRYAMNNALAGIEE